MSTVTEALSGKDSRRCKATTKNGRSCRNLCRVNLTHCHLHLNRVVDRKQDARCKIFSPILLAESGLVRIGTDSRDIKIQAIERVCTWSLNRLADFSTVWLISSCANHEGGRDISFNFTIEGIYSDKLLEQGLKMVQAIDDYQS